MESGINDFCSSLLCNSDPIIGSNVDSTSTLIMCIEGATAFNFTPYLLPCFIISGFSNFISDSVGEATPYPVVFTILSAVLVQR